MAANTINRGDRAPAVASAFSQFSLSIFLAAEPNRW
jgi:hypothetical protein